MAENEDHYAAALNAFGAANNQMGMRTLPEHKPLAQAIATIGVGHAILALIDELRQQRAGD